MPVTESDRRFMRFIMKDHSKEDERNMKEHARRRAMFDNALFFAMLEGDQAKVDKLKKWKGLK